MAVYFLLSQIYRRRSTWGKSGIEEFFLKFRNNIKSWDFYWRVLQWVSTQIDTELLAGRHFLTFYPVLKIFWKSSSFSLQSNCYPNVRLQNSSAKRNLFGTWLNGRSGTPIVILDLLKSRIPIRLTHHTIKIYAGNKKCCKNNCYSLQITRRFLYA